ncbi:MAG: hypothetical protein VX700_09325 [Pseudomonadota bacterium]|nr:hypothetical protein [Pseudomonadota bacterium]
MGLLVFGTPTLLFFGYGFPETLGLLLPSSLEISAMQVARPGIRRPTIPRHLFIFCLPAINAFMLLAIIENNKEYFAILVGSVLVMSAVSRLVERTRNLLTTAIRSHSAAYHIALGVVHGLTNLGGAMLAIFASSQYSNKSEVRYVIAAYYLAFVALQCTVLAISCHLNDLFNGIMIIPIAVLTHLVVGRPLFRNLQDRQSDGAMSVFIMAYGLVLLLKSLN